jgi:regulator of replication initiation timing
LNNLPNSKLKWEQKKDYNVGADIRVAGLTLKFDYYSADTKNMLTDVSIPTSTGFSSIKDNLGLVRNSGIELNANYTIWQGPEGFVNLYGTFVYNKNKIIRLSDSMRAYNEKMQKMAEEANQSAPVLMYQDGMSMNTIWAVPSAGIDPQTGQEVYIKKDGSSFTTDAYAMPTFDESGEMNGAISIQKDITEELNKKREIQLALMKDKSDIFIKSKEGNAEQNQIINELRYRLEKAQIELEQSLRNVDKYIYNNEKLRLENKSLKTEIALYKKNSNSNTAFKMSKENSDLRLENKKIKDKLTQHDLDFNKTVSQLKVNYEIKIAELEDKVNELNEKIDSIHTDDVLKQKLEYWKEKAKNETMRVENLEKQIIAHGDKNFMSKIFG